jgi:hypothetical protein
MRILIALVLVSTMACKKKETAAADNPCAAAVERGVDQTIAKRRAGNTQPMSPEEQEVPKKLKVALAKSCVDDKWAADVIDCYKTADDIAVCKEKLTPEQRAAYTRAAMGVMQGARGSGGMPAHGMGGPPAGSGGAPPSTDTPAGSGATPPTPPSPPPPPPSGGSN